MRTITDVAFTPDGMVMSAVVGIGIEDDTTPFTGVTKVVQLHVQGRSPALAQKVVDLMEHAKEVYDAVEALYAKLPDAEDFMDDAEDQGLGF